MKAKSSSDRSFFARLSKRIRGYVGKIKKIFNISIQHHYNGFSILLPADHLLPMLKEEYRLYDKFLPYLTKCLGEKTIVVDVGANCGDTLAAMYSGNKNLSYICVEPDEVFFEFLQTNVARIKGIDKDASIQTVKSLVGKNITGVSLVGVGGTKTAVFDDGKSSMSSRTLDQILSRCESRNVSLLKSDVDGFDYDVIDSAETMIGSEKPILFFECHFNHLFQKQGYEKIIGDLQVKGYAEWIVFDNFGEVILRTKDKGQLNQLFDYLWRQNANRSTRTIGYYDLLAFTPKDTPRIVRAMDDYIAYIAS